MSHSDYQRVNRKRVCLICGKTDWCSYTPDEKISFCARINQDADRISRTGWGVFYQEKPFSAVQTLPCPDKSSSKKPKLAPIEIRDFAYRTLIKLAPATNSKEITEGPKGLRERKILDFENYGSLPQSRVERNKIAKKIRCMINRNFPDYVREHQSSISGLPGFWVDKRGKVGLGTDKDYAIPMMLIPYRNADGFIQACQIRFMSRTFKGVRYIWLSSPKKSGGLSSGTPLHFASRNFFDSSAKPILITEGALKADTAQIFKPEFSVVAAGGVSCSHEEIINVTRFRSVLIAFDSDYRRNPQVARHIARLLEMRFADARQHEYNDQTNFLVWSDRFKGIDDALLNQIPMQTKTPSEWLKSLNVPLVPNFTNLIE
ncbi:DUF3854 domain-containing protein [soil metagenome]